MQNLTRTQRLKIACTAAGISVSDFARKLKVTEAAVRRAAAEKKGFPRIKREIDKFVSEKFRDLNIVNPVDRAA